MGLYETNTGNVIYVMLANLIYSQNKMTLLSQRGEESRTNPKNMNKY